MKSKIGILALGLAASFLPSSLYAEDVKFDGSVRFRYERAEQGTLGMGKDQTGNWITQQSRFGLKAAPKDNVDVYLQIQDARTWGGENHSFPPPSVTDTGTDASANALDLHQGYMVLKSFLTDKGSLKVGRQEIVFDDARLVGNIGWIQNAQSFDAMRMSVGGDMGSVDLVYSQVAAKDSHPVMNPYLASHTDDSFFYAAHGSLKVGKGVINPFIYVVDKPTRQKPGTDASGNPNLVTLLSLQTTGFFAKQKFGPVNLTAHLANQTGKITTTKNHKANMVAVKVGTKISDFGLSVAYDQYSGDKVKNGKESNTFNALYATNHAYFGFMDKFLFTPTTGLADTQLKLVAPMKKMGTLVLQAHNFSTAAGSYDGGKAIGSEVDLTYKLKAAGIGWQVGYSMFSSGSTTNYGSTGNTALNGGWSYLQMASKF